MIKKAFTLAEVLITLAIIGIVAAITIPTVQNNLNRTELETGFAKAFSTISHVVSLAQAENGALTNWDWKESYTKEDLENFAKQYILPYMNVEKNCKTEVDMGCFYKGYYKRLDKTQWSKQDNKPMLYKFITADGMSWGFGLKNGCIDAKIYCAYIRVDVNGKKGPNVYGRDIFTFELYPVTNELLPEGTNVLGAPLDEKTGKFPLRTREEIETNCNSKGGTSVNKLVVGAMCGTRLVQDGFKMNY